MTKIIELKVTDPETAAAVQQLNQRIERIEKNLPKPKSDLISRKGLSEYLEVSITTLINWDKKGITKPYTFGNRIRYKMSDVESMLNDSRDESTNS